MMMKPSPPPIDVVHLLPVLDDMLTALLENLSPAQWEKQTIAKLWKVKDVAAHLLDGNIRGLSIFRDNFFGENASGIDSYEELVHFLNRLNADWVQAMKRVSPAMLITLLRTTGKTFNDYFLSADPYAISVLPVSWAGESESFLWMEIARQYTEKWLHQQQIRDAIGDSTLLTKDFLYHFLDISMRALPNTFSKMEAGTGSIVTLTVTGEAGGSWSITKTPDRWQLLPAADQKPVALVKIDADSSWKLFSKSLRAADLQQYWSIEGDKKLGSQALEMVSFMA